MEKTAIVILAAGKGKRMKNPNLPKVLIPLKSKPLIGHVLHTAFELDPEKIVLIIGHLKESVIDFVKGMNSRIIEYAVQERQLGTGHAVAQAEDALKDFQGDVLILCGDVPLLRSTTLKKFIEEHKSAGSDVSVLTAEAPDPTGYGRIVRDAEGNFIKITEEKDATEEEKKITEFNSGVFFVESVLLFDALRQVSNENAQGEYYLTDIIDIARNRGKKTCAFKLADFDEMQGVNSPEDLERAEKKYEELYG
jgi:UDP-N-acetylglucosamine diphosphorylase/glucosamine-1-phosphate N-acetyltransferase